MAKERPALHLADEAERPDVVQLAGPSNMNREVPDPEDVKKVAEQSGFLSREGPKQTRRRRKKSPFTQQLGLKCRPEMRDLFQTLSDHLDLYDHTTFERAVLALIEKEGTEEHLETYKSIVK